MYSRTKSDYYLSIIIFRSALRCLFGYMRLKIVIDIIILHPSFPPRTEVVLLKILLVVRGGKNVGKHCFRLHGNC